MKGFFCPNRTLVLLILSGLLFLTRAENGSDLWLRYSTVADSDLLTGYRTVSAQIVGQGNSEKLIVARDELKRGLDGLLDRNTPTSTTLTMDGAIIIGTPSASSIINDLNLTLDDNPEAYRIVSVTIDGRNATVIASSGEIGVLYGAFHLLRLLQTNRTVTELGLAEKPKIRRRLLNHWDNLSGSVERGYAGNSLWKWRELPGTVSSRYKDYARACASVGINGTVLNNVNNSGNGQILSSSYIGKVAALANVFRPYGIRVYLSAYFDAPQEIGRLSTSDPQNAQVISWWKSKADEIYTTIPDFGGFLVKASSEGQAGPKAYGRTHAQGANCIADALAPHGGVVLWRSFVYDNAVDADRMKRAYMEFKPLDGQFRENVIIQSKNGPYDFQPREPVHPLFGGLNSTHVGMEFQVTLEYLGQNVQLVYMGPYWKEVLDFDTYKNGAGSTVGKVLDGTLEGNDTMTSISGVSNVGDVTNWCGHDFHQANWFAFGRLAWDHDLSSEAIADDWARMTWGNTTTVVSTVTSMMAGSREACVNYMTPLGLCGLFCMSTTWGSDHYGPCPDQNLHPQQPDWNAIYWHKADATGLGYNRTDNRGSNFVSQYFPTVRDRYNDIATTPPEYLAAFHHVRWDYVIPSTGRTFWDELCLRYCSGCQYVRGMRNQWDALSGSVDAERFEAVSRKLSTHEKDANTWRTTCLDYFKKFSNKQITSCDPTEIMEKPVSRKATSVVAAPLEIAVYTILGRRVAMLHLTGEPSAARLQSQVSKRLGQGIYIFKIKNSTKPNLVTNLGNATGNIRLLR